MTSLLSDVCKFILDFSDLLGRLIARESDLSIVVEALISLMEDLTAGKRNFSKTKDAAKLLYRLLNPSQGQPRYPPLESWEQIQAFLALANPHSE